jgi:hypothetical protein
MVVLIAVVLCVGLLYFWLMGHWFARVLVFLALAMLFALIAGGSMESAFDSAFKNVSVDQWWLRMPTWIAPVSVLFGLTAGPAAAWFTSMIPTYHWRHRSSKPA